MLIPHLVHSPTKNLLWCDETGLDDDGVPTRTSVVLCSDLIHHTLWPVPESMQSEYASYKSERSKLISQLKSAGGNAVFRRQIIDDDDGDVFGRFCLDRCGNTLPLCFPRCMGFSVGHLDISSSSLAFCPTHRRFFCPFRPLFHPSAPLVSANLQSHDHDLIPSSTYQNFANARMSRRTSGNPKTQQMHATSSVLVITMVRTASKNALKTCKWPPFSPYFSHSTTMDTSAHHLAPNSNAWAPSHGPQQPQASPRPTTRSRR